MNRDSLEAGAGDCASALPVTPQVIHTKRRAESLSAPDIVRRQETVHYRNGEQAEVTGENRRVEPKFTTADVTWSRDAPAALQGPAFQCVLKNVT